MSNKSGSRMLMLFVFALTLVSFQYWRSEAQAQSTFFTARGCVDCHDSAAATCVGCHHHSGTLTATKNKTTSYAPGETVTITLTTSSTRTGWFSARLYDQNGAEIARSSGAQSGMGGSTTFPATLSAPAPAAAGTYTWRMAYFGNEDGTGSGDVHSEKSVNVSITVAAAPVADTTAPVVGSFTLPASATSLTVPVSGFAATDNVAVTGYMITTSATAPAASAAGWTAGAPTSVTAVAGSNTFYAWAKDAAGNVSLSKSASVTVTLPDTTAPVVGSFTLPASAANLTIVVSAFSATDNVGVTGYLITTNSAAPAASAAGWSAAAPSTVTAVAGNNTFYAWAKDAAGNVSLSRSASVIVTLPDATAPVVASFTLPATATALTVPVSSFSATDNLAVTGYLITTSATAPAASAAGWSAAAPLSVTAVAGNNTFYAWAKDAAGNVSLSKSASVTVTIASTDTTKPTLAVSALADGSYTNKPTLNVSGNASDAGGLKSVTVNGEAAAVNADGSFSAPVQLTAGSNSVTVVATDMAGNEQSDSRSITFDPTAPVLAVSAPGDNSTSAQSFVTVTGTVNESSTVSVTDNGGSPQAASMNGNTFSATVNLAAGVNTITVTATDLAGNSASAKRTVTYTSGAMTLSVTSPAQDITTRRNLLVFAGNVDDAVGKVKVQIKVGGGKTYTPHVVRGSFRQSLRFEKPGQYAITVTATDAAGNKSVVTRNVIYKTYKKDRDDHDDDD